MNTFNQLAPQHPLDSARRRGLLQRIPKSLALVVLSLLLPWLIPGYFAAPVNFNQCWAKQTATYTAVGGLTLTRFVTKGSADIADGERFCDGEDEPLRLGGLTTLPDDAGLWLVVVGDRGQFYLHHPAAVIQSGSWYISDYHPGRDNRGLRLIRAGEVTQKQFLQRVADQNWSEFPIMPPDAQELARLALEAVPVCTQFDARHCVR